MILYWVFLNLNTCCTQVLVILNLNETPSEKQTLDIIRRLKSCSQMSVADQAPDVDHLSSYD